MALKPVEIALPHRMTALDGLPAFKMFGWQPGILVDEPVSIEALAAYYEESQVFRFGGMDVQQIIPYNVRRQGAAKRLQALAERYYVPDHWQKLPSVGQAHQLAQGALNAEVVANERKVIEYVHAALAAYDRAAQMMVREKPLQAAISWRVAAYLAWHFGEIPSAEVLFTKAIDEFISLPADARFSLGKDLPSQLYELYEARGDVRLEQGLLPFALCDYEIAQYGEEQTSGSRSQEMRRLIAGESFIDWNAVDPGQAPTSESNTALEAKLYVIKTLLKESEGRPVSVRIVLGAFQELKSLSLMRTRDSRALDWKDCVNLLGKGEGMAATPLFFHMPTSWHATFQEFADAWERRKKNTIIRLLIAREWREMEAQQWSDAYHPLRRESSSIHARGVPKVGLQIRLPASEDERFQQLQLHYGGPKARNKAWLVRSLIARVLREAGSSP